MAASPRDVIRRKRDGQEISDREIEGFIRGFVAGEVADYQMSALLMAIFLKGMSPAETAALTRIMVESGETLAFPGIAGIKVDKHSTGGVGDLVSLPLAPVAAACGVPVPMISGRGLGHTGGTLDKLESIGDLRTDLEPDRFRDVLRRAGFAMGGQTRTLAPADRRMYALRDVTATVESMPLIVSSILSKKVAAGIDALVLDVKCGRGAFMKTEEDALALAGELTRVGTLMGKRVVAFVTDMDTPLGTAVGNAVEVGVALECLRGEGPADLMELVTTFASAMVLLGERAKDWDEARARVEGVIADGTALERFRLMVEIQGGDVSMVDDPGRLPRSAGRARVLAPSEGIVTDVDPHGLGEAVVELGGGRRRAEDPIDPGVGVLVHRRRGDAVRAGEMIAEVLGADDGAAERVARERVQPAFTVGPEAPAERSLIRHLVTADGARPWEGGASWKLS